MYQVSESVREKNRIPCFQCGKILTAVDFRQLFHSDSASLGDDIDVIAWLDGIRKITDSASFPVPESTAIYSR